jgi:sugar/nucleoside kinase (ribokinase family)
MPPPPALLIVGGLTIDEFPDGRRAPGGSVLHSGRAAVAAGARPTILTVAGPEPEARDGLRDLESFASAVAFDRSEATTTYRHLEHDGRRVLVLEARGRPIGADAMRRLPGVDVALVAPIADELDDVALDALSAAVEGARTILLIQGWLRRLVVGEPVHPLALDEIPAGLWKGWGAADAVVVSTEDLAEDREDPFEQAAALRARLGPRPVLVVTLGAEGYLLDDPVAPAITATVPRKVVSDVPTVGAGDTFGAAYAVAVGRGAGSADAAATATDAVIAMLEARRAGAA